MNFVVPVDHREKSEENEKERQIPRPCQRTKKVMEHEDNVDANCNWCTLSDPQKLGKGAGRVENRSCRDHPKYSIKIGQNTEKSPGDLRRLAVTQTPVKNHQLTLM